MQKTSGGEPQDFNAKFGGDIYVVTGEHQRTAFFSKAAAEQYLAKQNPERFKIVVYAKPVGEQRELTAEQAEKIDEIISRHKTDEFDSFHAADDLSDYLFGGVNYPGIFATARGGGEWTALREALDDMRKEAKRLIDRSEVLANNGEKHRSDISLARGREIEGAIARLALAAAAPAPPAKVYALLDYEADGDALISVHATEESANKAKELVAPIRCWIQECDVVAPPPQDGQGAELLGPPRGGSSSDLADSEVPSVVQETVPPDQCFNCGSCGETQFVRVPLCADCFDEMNEVA